MNILPFADNDCERAVTLALDRVGDIATLPEITLKIVETVENPRSTARDLHQIVTHDLALSARILRVVNSAFYGLPGQVASIDRAIVMLGLNAVKNIAIAASLSRVFRGGRLSRKWTARDLWIHAVAVGTASKMIVESLQMALPDEAFVAGLIHDIGLVMMLQSNPPAMGELLRAVEQAEQGQAEGLAGADPVGLFIQLEQKLFGAGHEVFGSALARRWKFPRSFQYVTGYHHHPDTLARENRLLTQVVAVADSLCARLEIGMVVPVDAAELDPSVCDELGLTDRRIHRLREDLSGQVEIAMNLLD